MGWFGGSHKTKTSDYEPEEKDEEEKEEPEEEEADDVDDDVKKTLKQFEYSARMLEKIAKKDKLYAEILDFEQSPWTDRSLTETTKQEIVDSDADSDQIEAAFDNILESYKIVMLMFRKRAETEEEE
jgi:hypothetical protein